MGDSRRERSLGNGWSTLTKLVFMDFTGDGKNALGSSRRSAIGYAA